MTTIMRLHVEAETIQDILDAHAVTTGHDYTHPEMAAGACGTVSDILAEGLRDRGLAPDAHVVHCIGKTSRDGWDQWTESWTRRAVPALDEYQDAKDVVSHAVVALGDGTIIDATVRQFDRARENDAVRYTDEATLEAEWVTTWHIDPTYEPRDYNDRGGYYTPQDYQELTELLNNN